MLAVQIQAELGPIQRVVVLRIHLLNGKVIRILVVIVIVGRIGIGPACRYGYGMVRLGERGIRLVGISKGHVGTIGSPAVKFVIAAATGMNGNRFIGSIIACTGGRRITLVDCHRVFGGSLQFISVGAGNGNRSDLLTGPQSRERVVGNRISCEISGQLILPSYSALEKTPVVPSIFSSLGRILFLHSIHRADGNLRKIHHCGAGVAALGQRGQQWVHD